MKEFLCADDRLPLPAPLYKFGLARALALSLVCWDTSLSFSLSRALARSPIGEGVLGI